MAKNKYQTKYDYDEDDYSKNERAKRNHQDRKNKRKMKHAAKYSHLEDTLD